MSNNLLPLLWFVAILALIPALLWLLKRTPLGGAGAQGQMRTVAMLQIAPNQRLLTVEVGQGEDRRWLVLGVTAQQINTLHVMPPQPESASAGPAALPPFAQLLRNRLRKDASDAN
ncbi:MAG TPA: flagellar biosynthetic protein FliO [Roseateles sp.]|nr:flagellar biosynthetic protein FliO [Roseateles sp.]